MRTATRNSAAAQRPGPQAPTAAAAAPTISSSVEDPSKPNRLDVPRVLLQTTFNDKGEECTRKWMRGKFLGKGGFAEVYELTDAETGELFAGKIVAKASLQKKKAREKLSMEIRVHKSLHHRNIVKFVSYFEVNEFCVIVLELCANKSMMELLRSRKRLTEPEARYYLAQMVSALKYMHEKRIIHRDLKLGNIFLNAALEVKIGDFGLATQLSYDDERKKTICGTPNYIAPEVLHGGDVGHSYQVDVWSLGVVLYTWIFGKPPFETQDVRTTYQLIKEATYTFPDKVRVSDESKDLIKRMLQKNPDARPSLDEVLHHPFFTSHLTPTSLPSIAMMVEPKLPDMTKRVASAPVLRGGGTMDMENTVPNIQALAMADVIRAGVPSTAAMHVPPPLANVKSPGRKSLASPRGLRQSGAGLAGNKRPEWNLGPSQPARHSGGASSQQEAPSKQPRVAASGRYTLAEMMTEKMASDATSKQQQQRNVVVPGARENIVDVIHHALVSVLGTPEASGRSKAGDVVHQHEAPEPAVWIQRWVDYSSKCGLAYQYNTGSFGAYFNDSTIMVMDPEGTNVEYVERQKGKEVKDSFPVDAHPEELRKKVNLLQYFTTDLPAKAPAVGVVLDPKGAAVRAQTQPLVYVRKWLKTRHAVFFRLTDNTLQVNFTDNTGIILSQRGSVVTYIDKKNEMLTLWLDQVWQHEQGSSITSRLFYIKDMLFSLISRRTSPDE